MIVQLSLSPVLIWVTLVSNIFISYLKNRNNPVKLNNINVHSDTITFYINFTTMLVDGWDGDFQLADSSTATTTVIWGTVLSCTEWSIHITYA